MSLEQALKYLTARLPQHRVTLSLMPLVRFTANLQRHTLCPPREVPGATVAEALGAIFTEYPQLQGYIIDEHGSLRHHMVVFVDGQQIRDRGRLSDPVQPSSEIFVFQALSGGH